MAEPEPARDDAFELAVREAWTPVFRFALSMTNDLAEAEDVTQEAFARLWRERGRVDWSRPALPWLLVVARRLAVDRIRALRRRLTRPIAVPPSFDPSIVEAFADLAVDLRRLSNTERACLLTIAAGLTAAEVGEALGISPGAVRAAASRGREKLAANR